MNIHLDVLAASLMINILGLTIPIVMLHVYDRILGHHSVSTALLLFSAAFFAVIIDGILRYLRSLVLQIHSEPYALQAPIKLADKVISTDKSYTPTQIRAYFSKLNTLKNNYSGQSIVAILDLPFVFLYLYVLWFLAGDVAFVPGILFIVAVLASFALSAYAKKLSSSKETCEDILSSRLFNFFFHLDSKKNNNLVSLEQAKLNNTLSEHINHTSLQATLQSHLSSVIQVLSQLSTISVISFGGYKVIQGELTTGALAACSLLAGRCIAPVGALLNTGVRLQENSLAKASLTHFDSDINEECYTIENFSIVDQNCSQPAVYQINTLDDLKITYTDEQTIDSEYIKIDKHAPLFSGTVIDNLTGFNPFNSEGALKLCSQLSLNEYFNKLPKGYQSEIQNDRFDLYDSSIKIQIALVRAIISDKKFVLVDDILSYFDPASRNRLISFLHSQESTIFIVKDPLMLSKAEFLKQEEEKAKAIAAQKEAMLAAMGAANA